LLRLTQLSDRLAFRRCDVTKIVFYTVSGADFYNYQRGRPSSKAFLNRFGRRALSPLRPGPTTGRTRLSGGPRLASRLRSRLSTARAIRKAYEPVRTPSYPQELISRARLRYWPFRAAIGNPSWGLRACTPCTRPCLKLQDSRAGPASRLTGADPCLALSTETGRAHCRITAQLIRFPSRIREHR
jgi:hypothetical protein